MVCQSLGQRLQVWFCKNKLPASKETIFAIKRTHVTRRAGGEPEGPQSSMVRLAAERTRMCLGKIVLLR